MKIAIAIYIYRDPQTNSVMYVGQTSDPDRRISQHFKTRSPLADWLWSQVKAGRQPIHEVIEWVDANQADARERDLIREYRDAGEPILNIQHMSEPLIKVGDSAKPERDMVLDDYRELAALHSEKAFGHISKANSFAERANARFSVSLELPFPGKKSTD